MSEYKGKLFTFPTFESSEGEPDFSHCTIPDYYPDGIPEGYRIHSAWTPSVSPDCYVTHTGQCPLDPNFPPLMPNSLPAEIDEWWPPNTTYVRYATRYNYDKCGHAGNFLQGYWCWDSYYFLEDFLEVLEGRTASLVDLSYVNIRSGAPTPTDLAEKGLLLSTIPATVWYAWLG